MTEPIQVEAYSGISYAERPRAFIWRGRRYEVVAVPRRWRSASPKPGRAVIVHFLVRTTEGEAHELVYDEGADEWMIRSVPARTINGEEEKREWNSTTS